MNKEQYNPDVLNCLANLSNDEVFTPPTLANQMLDLLPQELFCNAKTTFLDPFCKSGVFLREIVKRLDRGLQQQMPDRQQRIDHILHNQVFGIAITELTSLLSRRSVYCSKSADGKHSVSHFDNPEGNIQYRALRHTWENGKCVYCGANQQVYDRGESSEQYAYQFIHTKNPEKLFNMKFDVIIGNPPYQLSDGGNGSSATPIYHHFVEQAKLLSPKYLIMIIPARWYAGGKGLDDFRMEMITDLRIRRLDDFLNASDCFGNGVEIKGGVCYFLWDKDNLGKCKIVTHESNSITSISDRYLRIGDSDIFVRRNESINILAKITQHKENSFSTIISSRKPFGLPTNIKTYDNQQKGYIKIYQRGGTAFFPVANIEKNKSWIDKHKIYITKAYNAGDDYPHQIINKPIYGDKGTCCSETYLLIGPFDSKEIANNVISYIHTKLFRFLVSLRKISQDATQKVYQFVPLQDFSHPWTDEMLYKKYNLTKEEIAFIESMIRPME